MPGIRLNKQTPLKFWEQNDIFEKMVYGLFKPMYKGRLDIVHACGKKVSFGMGSHEVSAKILVHNRAFFRKCVLFGDIGFAESYMDGDWETESIKDVIEWMILNLQEHPTLMSDTAKRKPVNFLKIINDVYHRLRANTVKGSRKNIEGHYDLGNDFFSLFLDPTMTYSSAYFQSLKDSLEDGQKNKYEKICQKIHLKHTDCILEIGCGWGGFAVYAAKNYGCQVTGITISRQQFEFATQRIQQEGLSGRVKIIFEDYRKVKGQYDKVISIEMIEAVGHEFYKAFFAQCHSLLKKDGLLALQMILAPDGRYQSFRRNADFIQKHIFPGSLLPSLAVLQRAINKTGTLCLYDYEDITAHYVKTLMLWRERFKHNHQLIASLDFSERFLRKWEYYFEYCAAAFKMRNITVAQAVFTRPNNLAIS